MLRRHGIQYDLSQFYQPENGILDLSDLIFTQENIELLIGFLKENPINEIILRRTSFHEGTALKLAEVIQGFLSPETKILKWDLGQLRITTYEDQEVLAKSIASYFQKQKNLSALFVDQTSIAKFLIDEIAPLLADEQIQIEKIDLSSNSILMPMLTLILKSSALTSLNLSECFLNSNFELRMTEHELAQFCDALQKNMLLTYLNLSKSPFKDEKMMAILSALKNHPTITELDLSSTQIGDQSAILLASLETLKNLRLSWNQIEMDGAIALMRHKGLIEIDLRLNQIYPGDNQQFERAVMSNKTIQKLALDNNYIHQETIETFNAWISGSKEEVKEIIEPPVAQPASVYEKMSLLTVSLLETVKEQTSIYANNKQPTFFVEKAESGFIYGEEQEEKIESTWTKLSGWYPG